MANPHSGYPHQGPAYYQPSPPPTHVYGTHSPGPGHSPNPYHQYVYPSHPPPPHHNTLHHHHHHHPHTPTSGRMNGRGGSYQNRGGHGHPPHIYHQNFHPPQHQTYPHPLLHAPHPQHPHAQHPAKFPHPYTPPYPYPSPTSAGPYSPSWQAQQPQSPLPKQLTMPPARGFSPAYYEPPSAPPPPHIHPPVAIAPEPPAAVAAIPITSPLKVPPEAPIMTKEGIAERSNPESTNTQAPEVSEEAAASPKPEPAVESESEPEPQPGSAPAPTSTSTSTTTTTITTTFVMGSITSNGSATSSNIPPSPTHSISSARTHSHKLSSSSTSFSINPVASIAIWSRRPGDPSKAPGIIISPRARPPSEIIQQALSTPTPPVSPKPIVSSSLPEESQADKKAQEEKKGKVLESPSMVQEKITSGSPGMLDSSISSSAVTEVTDAPTLPGSPISSRTSISTTGGTFSQDVSTTTTTKLFLVEDGQTVTPAHPSSSDAAVVSTSSTPIPSTSKTPEPETKPTPAPAPAAPKSWASLFASSSSSAHPTTQRSALPTSSVIGFSIPATPTTPTIPVLPAKKSELLSLLTHGLGSLGAPSASQQPQQQQQQKIRTRGLINSGNMCFANAVLQVLVYCTPFQRLFIELGRLLGKESYGDRYGGVNVNVNGTATTSASSASTSANAVMGNGHVGKSVKSQTPFIDATVEFLKEFIVEEEKERERKKGGFGYGKGGKGKEKEVVRDGYEDDEEGDEWPQSFLPSYVYEAMKEKKRFESMRGGQQEDAEEFLGFYLDTLEEELLYIQNSLAPPPKAVKQQQVEEKEEPEPPEEEGWLEVGKKNRMIVTRTIKAVESPITRIFGGKFKSTLKAPGQKDSVIVEDWRSLRLDIQRDSIHTIQDALAHITDPQPVQVTNPTKPGVIIDASQKVLVEALPPVLVLHVKRFCYDTAVGGVVKVTKPVRFEPELEIGSDMMAPTGKRAHPTKYRLFGAIYHHGHSASGGHYTLDVLHPSRYPGAKLKEGWVRIDDELVSDVRPEDVFDTWEKDETRNAYLLFYRRIRA